MPAIGHGTETTTRIRWGSGMPDRQGLRASDYIPLYESVGALPASGDPQRNQPSRGPSGLQDLSVLRRISMTVGT